MSPKVGNAIICDIVRIENTGKHILIGVYSGDIVFQALPALQGFSFYIEVAPNVRNAEFGFELRIDVPGRDKPMELTGSMPVKDEEVIVILLAAPNIHVQKAGLLKVSLRFSGGRWIEVISKKIIVQQLPLPTP